MPGRWLSVLRSTGTWGDGNAFRSQRVVSIGPYSSDSVGLGRVPGGIVMVIRKVSVPEEVAGPSKKARIRFLLPFSKKTSPNSLSPVIWRSGRTVTPGVSSFTRRNEMPP